MLPFIAVLLTAGLWHWLRPIARAERVWMHPAWRGPFRLERLHSVADFLELPELIVSGHRGRRVGRVMISGRMFYLKREERVSLRTRLTNWLAGNGWSSLSLREARMLQTLERTGLPAPRCAAYGEDDAGGAFVLIEAVNGTPLPEYLRDHPTKRRDVAKALGQVLARVHAAGYVHHDLYAKHVLISDEGLKLIDWQRAKPETKGQLRDLATLHATIADSLADPRDRITLLRAYGGRCLARRVEAEAFRLMEKRHIREKRGVVVGQSWTCQNGRGLCVAPALGPVPEWLRLEQMPLPPGQTQSRRWLVLPDGRRVLMIRRRSRTSAMDGAHLIWRLERHGVSGPRVLAAGERGRDSFLLIELPNAIRLGAWLILKRSAQRMEAWRQAAALMQRIRDAGRVVSPDGLGVTPDNRVVLLFIESVSTPSRCITKSQPSTTIARPNRINQEAADVIPTGWRSGRRGYERPDWPEFVGTDWTKRIMEVEVTDRFNAKQGRSTGRWMLHARDGRQLVVYLKRHYRLGWWACLFARLWPSGNWSPAMQEAKNLEWARQQGVPVPAVVAAGELISPEGEFQSYLAVEELTDQMAVHEALPIVKGRLTPDQFSQWKRGLAAEMARLSRILHDRQHFHKDLYLCHFYVREEDMKGVPSDWTGRVSLIDLHRLAYHPWTWRIFQSKDIAQLLYSSETTGVTFRDRVAFWRAYRGTDTPSTSRRWMLRLIDFRWRRYRHHNLRHKARTSASSSLLQEVQS
ncbi:MAG: hypothetical protein EBV06_02425 [Planctomycetia bacterium]|nr:hypothetical protein [Planctomycetia bacterium]